MPDKNVQLPDGRVVAFPDSMADADISAVIKKQLASSAKQEPGLIAKGFDLANQAVSKLEELSPIPLPKGLSDIPNWAKHMIGQAPDSKVFWDDIHQAVKNPSQENLVKAVPMFGPASVDAAADARAGKFGSMLFNMIKPTAQVAAAGALSNATTSGMAARTFDAADKAKVAASSDLNKAIPATKSTPYTPEDVQAAMPYLQKEHADSPITSVKELRDSADAAVQKIEGQVHNAITSVSANHTLETDFWPQTLGDVKSVLSENARGAAFVKAGLKELEDFQLDQPKTLFQQDAIRRQLNAENAATLRKNNYTVEIARKSDPAFAAREAAAESIRNSIYDTLDKQGYDTGSLRQDEGSVIKLRNAAENQIYNAEKKVTGTAGNQLGRQIASTLVTSGTAGIGGALGGGPGAMAGATVGKGISSLFSKDTLTRNELVERSFSIPQGNPTPFNQPPSGAASIGDILKAKGINALTMAPQLANAPAQQQQTPQLPFHPGAGIPKP